MRDRIIAEAISWEGTPFHDCAGVKGAGCDCVHLLKRVYVDAGAVPDFEIEPYKPQWFLHRDEPVFLQGLMRHAHEVESPAPADVVMINYGRHAAHAGIVIDERIIIHAFKPIGAVTRGSLTDYQQIPKGERGSIDSYWSIF